MGVEASGDGADPRGQRQVLLRGAVGKVQPKDIGSGQDQLLHHGFR